MFSMSYRLCHNLPSEICLKPVVNLYDLFNSDLHNVYFQMNYLKSKSNIKSVSVGCGEIFPS